MIPILYAEFWFLKKKLIRMALVEFRCKCITYYATVREMILEHRPMTAPNKHYNRNLVFWEENLKPTSNTIFGIPSCSCGIFLWMLANNFYQYRFRPSSPTVCPGCHAPTNVENCRLVIVIVKRIKFWSILSCWWKMPSDVMISCRMGPIGTCDRTGLKDPDPNSSSF